MSLWDRIRGALGRPSRPPPVASPEPGDARARAQAPGLAEMRALLRAGMTRDEFFEVLDEFATTRGLVALGAGRNFSQYTAGKYATGTNVRTVFTRVRIDPGTFAVEFDDVTFSSSTGLLLHGNQEPVTVMPYGVASGCEWNYVADGLANIDLTGTPFRMLDNFARSAPRGRAGRCSARTTRSPTSPAAAPAAGPALAARSGRTSATTRPCSNCSISTRSHGANSHPAIVATASGCQPSCKWFASPPDAAG
ncbi:hypothetical protein [Nannocystis bainbridge]|uniref:Uncharacterized protein n=1 Tax=Nannocystis bainbridge TaxID=2995303 RepID=A0ABT5DT78_9BACT|nr:hypothetical protein [Nannocystis bainbridge]MDC0716847.1 hypothetical protein [Nannocystis bainbridge]